MNINKQRNRHSCELQTQGAPQAFISILCRALHRVLKSASHMSLGGPAGAAVQVHTVRGPQLDEPGTADTDYGVSRP